MKTQYKLLLNVLFFIQLGSASAEETVTTRSELQQLQIQFNNLNDNYQSTVAQTENSILRRYAYFKELPESVGSPNYK